MPNALVTEESLSKRKRHHHKRSISKSAKKKQKRRSSTSFRKHTLPSEHKRKTAKKTVMKVEELNDSPFV